MKNSFLTLPLIGLAFGIYTQKQLGGYCVLGAAGIALLIVLVLRIFFKKHQMPYWIGLLFFLGGAGLLVIQQWRIEQCCSILCDQSLDLIATVSEKTYQAYPNKGQILELTINKYKASQDQQYRAITCKILCYTHYPTRFQVADIIDLRNVILEHQQEKVQDHNKQSTFRDYLVKEDIVATVFLHKPITTALIHRPQYSLQRWLWRVRNDVYIKLRKKLSSPAFNFYALIFLGNKQQPHLDELRRSFNYWGLAHYLARSGLHIVLFIMIWQWFLSFIPLHITYKRWLLMLLCWMYSLMSWDSIPFSRALFAFMFVQIGGLLDRSTHFLHILLLICTLILLYNPMQLFFLDFQLTFGLTFALVWLGTLPNRQVHDTANATQASSQ